MLTALNPVRDKETIDFELQIKRPIDKKNSAYRKKFARVGNDKDAKSL